MFIRKILLLCLLFSLVSPLAEAFENKTFSLGLGYHSRNILNRIATKSDGSTSLLGVTSFPFIFQYDWNFHEAYFVAPQLAYTFMPQVAADKSTSTTMMHLAFPVGMNFLESGKAEWFVGPGLIQYAMKGKGGTKTMNNGTSTTESAVPGRSVAIRNYTFNVGAAYNFSKSRVALTLISENFISNTRRTQSLNLAYTYRFSEQ